MTPILRITIPLLLALLTCAAQAAGNLTYGERLGDTYQNDYFPMSITVPDGWHWQSRAAIREQMRVGKELVAGNDRRKRAALDASKDKSAALFTVFRHKLGTPVAYNQNIGCVAEKVSHVPGVRRGSDYFFHAKKLLLGGQIQYKFPRPIYSMELGGRQFDVMPASVNYQGVRFKQDFIATRIKDYILLFVLSYQNQAQLNDLRAIMDSLTFDVVPGTTDATGEG